MGQTAQHRWSLVRLGKAKLIASRFLVAFPLALSLAHSAVQAQQDQAQTNQAEPTPASSAQPSKIPPAKKFDLSHWKLTLPVDDDRDGRADGIRVAPLQSYYHPDFFYLDDQGHMVFTAPNLGGTTVNSANTRSELRYMIRGTNRKYKNRGPFNNFALASHPKADEFVSIGGRMLATLHIDHVPTRARRPNDNSAFAGVIGQIHGVRLREPGDDYGFGNEPLKIVYKKWPHHKTGSVYWHYERNWQRGHPDRRDIAFPVWGKERTDDSDPGESGIALGEDFSYIVNVYGDTMYLTFLSERLGIVRQQVNLANNIDPNGKVDPKDRPTAYAKDAHYFKAGVYNQCRGAIKEGQTEARCYGTGNWAVDKANGDYFQVSFSRLEVTQPTPPTPQLSLRAETIQPTER